jgi:hypothetical protein
LSSNDKRYSSVIYWKNGVILEHSLQFKILIQGTKKTITISILGQEDPNNYDSLRDVTNMLHLLLRDWFSVDVVRKVIHLESKKEIPLEVAYV